jgi:site-specific DNA recombinase
LRVRLSRKGTKSGGESFSRGALYELLSNPIYIGEIRHKRERHPGQHQPILQGNLWEQVQQRLCSGTRRDLEPTTKAASSPLAGKVFDEDGAPLYARNSSTSRGGKTFAFRLTGMSTYGI